MSALKSQLAVPGLSVTATLALNCISLFPVRFFLAVLLLSAAADTAAQTAPVIARPAVVDLLVGPIDDNDNVLGVFGLAADTPVNSPVTWQVQVSGRTLPVSVGYTEFTAPTRHYTSAGIQLKTSDVGSPVTVLATNAFGTSSMLFGTVKYRLLAPEITVGARKLQVVGGSDVSLSLGVTGSPRPLIQWRKDGAILSGATNAKLVIPNVLPGDAGTYEITARNEVGSVVVSILLMVSIRPVSFTLQPEDAAAPLGGVASFNIGVAGSPPIAYQWRKSGVNIVGATQSTLTLSGLRATDAGDYDVVASNPANEETSATVTLTISASAPQINPPVITAQPRPLPLLAGGTASFEVTATGTVPLTYQWRRDGQPIAGATGAMLSLTNAQPAQAGAYSVVITNAGGSVTSTSALLTVLVPPAITRAPESRESLLGSTVTLTVTATGTAPLAYQWRRNDQAIPGATASTFTVASVRNVDAGEYSVQVTNSAGSAISTAARLAVNLPGRLVNLSVLTELGSDEDAFTLGLSIGGAQAAGAKPVLMRAMGPSLVQFGVATPLADPLIEMYSGNQKVGENGDWNGLPATVAAASQVGAFPFASAQSKDAALLAMLEPNAYSLRVSAGPGIRGPVLAELYDNSPATEMTAATPRLTNISVLKAIGSGVTAGFVIAGTTDVTVLIRAIGPTLTAFGVGRVVADPRLEVRRGDGSVAGANDDWPATPELTSAFTRVGAFRLEGPTKDSALIATLAPGSYTVLATGAAASTGTVLLEIYEVP